MHTRFPTHSLLIDTQLKNRNAEEETQGEVECNETESSNERGVSDALSAVGQSPGLFHIACLLGTSGLARADNGNKA